MSRYGFLPGELSMNTFASRFAVLAFALSAVSLAPAAFAQDNGAPADSAASPQSSAPMRQGADPQKQAAHMAKRLALSDDQSSKLLGILQNRQQQVASVRGDSSLSQQDRRAKMRSIQQDTESQINALLTPAQQTQYANLKQMQRQRMQNARSQGASSQQSGSDSSSGSNSGGN
jgi:periplasmic protein CpxP/Spy